MNIQCSSREFYFEGDFLETVLFTNNTFILMKNGVATIRTKHDYLPDDIRSSDVFSVRMIDHIVPEGITRSPIVLFVLIDSRVLVYEYFRTNAYTSLGFWKCHPVKVEVPIKDVAKNLTPVKLVETIDCEKTNEIVKVTNSSIYIDEDQIKLI